MKEKLTDLRIKEDLQDKYKKVVRKLRFFELGYVVLVILMIVCMIKPFLMPFSDDQQIDRALMIGATLIPVFISLMGLIVCTLKIGPALKQKMIIDLAHIEGYVIAKSNFVKGEKLAKEECIVKLKLFEAIDTTATTDYLRKNEDKEVYCIITKGDNVLLNKYDCENFEYVREDIQEVAAYL